MTKALKLVEASPEALADHIGQLRADIDELKQQLKGAEGLLYQQTGGEPAEGKLFRVVFTTGFKKVVNWKGIAEKLGASRQIISANTKQSEVNRVVVTAKRK
jgi:biotin operon repressor